MIDTPQQELFYATAAGKGSVALKARAGTGKTHAEQQWAVRAKGTGISTSFSRPTALELGKKMPARFPAATIHSICLRAITKSGVYKKTENQDPLSPQNKLYNVTKELLEELGSAWDIQSPVMQLVSAAKTYGIVPTRHGREGLRPDEPEEWEALADQYDVPFNEEILTISREVLNRSNELALKQGYLDFDDMLYIATLWPHRFTKVPTIIIDEAQDLSSIQVSAIGKMLLPGGRVIAAGDDRQAIYGFRGALTDSYSVLVDKFGMSEYPLTWSFRCPRAVIHEAQRFVPDIEAAPGAIEGDVITHDELNVINVPKAVICRNNAPLIRLALKLLVAGRTAEVAGRDIGKGLISLTKRITKRNLDTADFIIRLEKWAEREISRKPRSKARVQDKMSALKALAEHHADLRLMQKHLNNLYPDPKSKSYRPAEVHLSTIHKAKGREWPEVLFLDPHLIPSRYAEQEWEIQQENNMAYVGITRAQRILHYAKSDTIWSA